MKKRCWQVQIWVADVEEWYGWSEDYDETSLADCKRVERIASQKYGWKTRVVRVS
jgi:hypothetical protein